MNRFCYVFVSPLLAALFFWHPALPDSAAALDITVDDGGDDSLGNLDGDGSCSLREAINNANSAAAPYQPSADCDPGSSGADTVKFNGVSSVTLVDEIFVISDVKLQGTAAVSGGGATRMFTVASGSGVLRLSDMTLEDGSDASGGAIVVQDVDALLECDGSTFKLNQAENNGGAIDSRGTLDIDGCSFEQNEAGNDGGAIHKLAGSNITATLTIAGSNFEENKAGTDPAGQTDGGVGGALAFVGSVGAITGSRFNKNTAAFGKDGATNTGGGAIHTSAVLTITATVFAGNQAAGDQDHAFHGGAVFNAANGTLNVSFSHFGTTPLPLPAPFDTLTDPNQVLGEAGIGGAVYNLGTALVLGTSFIGNTSAHHGGAFGNGAISDEVVIANSTFSANAAADQGGAIYHLRDDALLALLNVTVAGNTAGEGGGIFNAGDGDDNAGVDQTEFDEILLKNTILSDNAAPAGPNCGGGTASAEGTNNLVFPAGAGCLNAPALANDPVLGSPELTFSLPTIVTYALPPGAGSAALGAGSAAVCSGFPVLNLDQRAFPRPQGDPDCDIGAYESGASGATPTPTPSMTPSPDPSAEPSASPTPSATPTPEEEETPTPTGTATPTPTPSATPSATPTPEEEETPTPTGTATPTPTPSAAPTPAETATPAETPSSSATPAPTAGGADPPTAAPTPAACKEVVITGTQLDLDGRGRQQAGLVTAARRMIFKHPIDAATRAAVNRLAQTAHQAYLDLWTTVWGFESVIRSCEAAPGCTALDNSAGTAAIQSASRVSADALREAVSILRTVTDRRRAGRRLKRSSARLQRRNAEDLASIPASHTVCE